MPEVFEGVATAVAGAGFAAAAGLAALPGTADFGAPDFAEGADFAAFGAAGAFAPDFGVVGAFVVAAFDAADLLSFGAAGLAPAVDFGAGVAADDFDAITFGLTTALAGEGTGFVVCFLPLASFFAAPTFAGFVTGTLAAFATGSSLVALNSGLVSSSAFRKCFRS